MEKENKYAKRIEKVQMSSIRIVMEKVEKLRNQGKSVVSLCAGEPDFNTPEGIKKATIEALNDNQTHYSSNRGYLGLRQKVSQLLKQQTTIDYDSDQEIIMTCGCSVKPSIIRVRLLLMKGTKLLFLHQPLFLIKIQFYYVKEFL